MGTPAPGLQPPTWFSGRWPVKQLPGELFGARFGDFSLVEGNWDTVPGAEVGLSTSQVLALLAASGGSVRHQASLPPRSLPETERIRTPGSKGPDVQPPW